MLFCALSLPWMLLVPRGSADAPGLSDLPDFEEIRKKKKVAIRKFVTDDFAEVITYFPGDVALPKYFALDFTAYLELLRARGEDMKQEDGMKKIKELRIQELKGKLKAAKNDPNLLK